MLERYNPILRIVCLALTGFILYQVSKLAFKREAVAISRIEAPTLQLNATTPSTAATNFAKGDTNSASSKTNPPTSTNSTAGPTNSNSAKVTGATVMAMNRRPPGGPGGGGPKPNLPPDVQALVDKIKQNQLFGPEMKPPPMALLGIAGKDVFLRGPNGQTGMIREGEELGGAKLIRIGTNRVIVEQDGQQKELMIFDGFGSETLLEKKDKQ